MEQFLGHKSVIIRFISLYCLGLVLFFISWTLAYYLLPEGALPGGFLAKLAGDTAADTMMKEFLTIFGLNLIGMLFIVIGNLILRVKYFSFGYLVPLAWMIMYGATIGTNSFSIQMTERMAPTLEVFSRAGLYEMMAVVLLAVATNTISVNKSESFFSKSRPIPEDERSHLEKEQWVAVSVSILLLAGAALREAYMIINLQYRNFV